ncbi:imidazolonepropionase [Muriicola marianensis]|uniref:Imidazolonepropionase n=1 Tax=Muriicola marianensis TaxID=1324801 RepID=A0ABQ1QXI6_9FLAO|nr:imidazolonepropionase [Muriicola marianensis]GGD47157.1 imidazolonepropionase [Muriicola marianensis]
MAAYSYFGPITELVSMDALPLKGAIPEDHLRILKQQGILTRDGMIQEIGGHEKLLPLAKENGAEVTIFDTPVVALPGLIDCHTHICFSGSRARDYALRNAGSTYLEIAKAGGGIWDTVTRTRLASEQELIEGIAARAGKHITQGVTTIEVKSGYGLTVEEELKMLRAIRKADHLVSADLISTCLAAHMLPRDYPGSSREYLEMLGNELLPRITKEGLSKRVDAFVEEGAFSPADILPYFEKARDLGFEITVHADQFTTGGSQVAIDCGALSADHLEASTPKEVSALAQSDVIAVALPGASLGLGCDFTPARALLDAGAGLAIASDHNPGSAPMGQLLTQAAILGAKEKLTTPEVIAGITCRAAAALNISDRGILRKGMLADLVLFPTHDHREILYHQGSLQPAYTVKKGKIIHSKPEA